MHDIMTNIALTMVLGIVILYIVDEKFDLGIIEKL